MHRRSPAGSRRFAMAGSALVALLALLVLACASKTLEQVRAAQHPQDFHYITKGEIKTKMGELAAQVVSLDALLSQEGGPKPEEREKVLAILQQMRRVAGQLKKAGSRSSHPRIDAGAPRLVADIDRAIAEVRIQQPPTYYQAGRVVGSCSYCHESRLSHGAE